MEETTINSKQPYLRPVVTLIIYKDGKILLQKREDNGMWALHGGGMEIGETYLETLKRENLINVEVIIYDNLSADVALECNANFIIRGLRNDMDYRYEENLYINACRSDGSKYESSDARSYEICRKVILAGIDNEYRESK